jgi:hypothetical protein
MGRSANPLVGDSPAAGGERRPVRARTVSKLSIRLERHRDRGSDSAFRLVARGLDREPAFRRRARAAASLLRRLPRSGLASLRRAGARKSQPGARPRPSAVAGVRPERDGPYRSDSSGRASFRIGARARSPRPSRSRHPLRADRGPSGFDGALERGGGRASDRSHRRPEPVDSRPRARSPRPPGPGEFLAAPVRIGK